MYQLWSEVNGNATLRNDGKWYDVHFREGDQVMFYAGLTRPLVLRLSRGGVRAQAAPAYRNQSCASGVFDRDVGDLSQRAVSWAHYLAAVEIRDSCWHGEGHVQNGVSMKLGYRGTSRRIFSLDREAVIGFEGRQSKQQVWGKIHEEMRAIGAALSKKCGYAQPGGCGNELDALLWDAECQTLMITEMKDGGGGGPGVYYAPLQVAAYFKMWRQFMSTAESAWEGLTRMVRQKQELKLLPQQELLRWPDSPDGVKLCPAIVVPNLPQRGQTQNRFTDVWHGVNESFPSEQGGLLDDLRVYDWQEPELIDITDRLAPRSK